MVKGFRKFQELKQNDPSISTAAGFTAAFGQRSVYKSSTFSDHFSAWTKASNELLVQGVLAGRTEKGVWMPIVNLVKPKKKQ